MTQQPPWEPLEPGSERELQRFAELQQRLAPLFQRVFPDRHVPRTVVVIPSISLDLDVLANIAGVLHYEERLLCILMLLRLPRTRITYITSMPVDPSIIDYYVHLLPGVPGIHARKRLTLLSCNDGSLRSTLTAKVLERPRLIEKIRASIQDPELAHMTCFNATDQERTLAVRLGIPLFANDPALEHLGNKSGSRKVFREAGVAMPDGMEDMRDEHDVAESLAELKRRDPGLRRAVVKLEEGTSGEGNAVFDFADCPDGDRLTQWVLGELPARLCFEKQGLEWEQYRAQLVDMGGIVECLIEGEDLRSPSVQYRINPLGEIELVSTHDQVLGGRYSQAFQGSHFPADEAYRVEIHDIGLRVARVLREKGALGRLGVDLVSVPEPDGWRHYAVEVNLRKGGTTHTFYILQFLTDGTYDAETGLFLTPRGEPRFYYASDNLKNANYKRLTPDDLMDVVVENGLHFDATTQEGVFFHLIGALSGYGKLGLVCVSDGRGKAYELYRETVEVLDREALREP